MEVIRHGKYKSAVEPFLANEMSEANRTQIKELLDAFWQSMLTNISESRDISVEDLNQIADTLGTRTSKYAALSGLIDEIVYFDEYESMIKEKIGIDTAEDINYVPISDYIRTAGKIKLNSGNDKIAVIFAQGEIWYGEGGSDVIGQGIINDALKKAREDKNVKAIVLRVNSREAVHWPPILFGARSKLPSNPNQWWSPWAMSLLREVTTLRREPIRSSPNLLRLRGLLAFLELFPI